MKTYRLISNHLDQNASYNGCMFETFGPEAEFVRQQAPERIWTLTACDGQDLIHAGWHLVDRLGYLVSEEPWTDETEWYEYDNDIFQTPKEANNDRRRIP